MAPGLTDNECSVCQKRKSRRWFVPLDDESPPLCKSCHAKNAKSGLKKPPPLTCTIVEKDGKRIGYARPNPESAFRRSALLYKASEDEAQSLVEATGTSSDAPDLAKVSDRPENPSPTDDAQVLLEVAAPGGQQSGSAINGGRADPGPQTAGGVLPPSVLATKEQLQESREELPADLRARELARKPQKEAAKVDGRRGAGASSEQGQEGSVLPALPASAGQQESPQDVAEVPRKGVLAPAIGQEADFLAAHIVEGARRRSKRRVSQESASDVLMTSARKPSGVKRAKRKTAVETDAEEERPEKKRSLQEIDERSVQRVSKPAPKAAHAEKLSPSAEERGEEVEKASYGTGQQCVGCGATASRRWYGGGNKCSKCYDREYEKKRRARSGGSEGEGSAPSNEVWGVEAPGAFQLAINGSEPSGGVKRKRGRPPLGKPKPLPGKNVAAEPNEPGRKRGRPPLGKPKAPPEEETAKPDEPGRKQGRAPLGTSNPPAGKEMAAEPDEAGQCADCGRRETSRWYGGAGGPQSQCQKCREKGLGGVCQSCGAESSSVWYGGSQGPRTTCSACYAERLNPKDSGAALEGAAKGGSLSAEMNVSEAVSGEGIPLTRELVSRRVEVWCPVDNR